MANWKQDSIKRQQGPDSSPPILQDALSEKVRRFEEWGFAHGDVSRIVCRQPAVFALNFVEAVCPKLQELEGRNYQGHGLSREQVQRLVVSYPTALTLSLVNISTKLDYLVNNMRREVCEVATCPAYLASSLDERIKPRAELLASLGRSQEVTLRNFISSTDAEFCKKLGVGQAALAAYKLSRA